MENSRNMIIAIVLSVAIFVVWQIVFVPEPVPVAPTTTQPVDPDAPPSTNGTATPSVTADVIAPETVRPRDVVLAETPRVRIESPELGGSITLKGGRLDDITLVKYRETAEANSPQVVLLAPRGTEHPYYVNFGWANSSGAKLPDNESVWTADGDVLSPGKSVTLTWDNGEGLVFERIFTIDEDFLLTIKQRVTNKGATALDMAAFGRITRVGVPAGNASSYLLHEGPVGVLNDTLEEYDYDDLAEAPGGQITTTTTGGWAGITDKYWSVLLVPEQTLPVTSSFIYLRDGQQEIFRTDMVEGGQALAPGGVVESQFYLYAGAKSAAVVDSYDETYGLQRFYLAVDYGWIFFLARPIYLALDWFYGLIGNFGVAIMLLVCCVRLLLFPLANKSYRSMAKMRKLQPKMLELRERFKDDKPRFQREMMELYKKEGANPLAGCLPILVQIPIFMALYNVLYGTIEMRHAPFFGWIQDLSAPDPTTWVNLFGLLPFDRPSLGILDILQLGIWPIIMGITMWLQSRLNPQPTDPIQAKIFAWMPIIFTFMLGQFQAGLVIYWCWNNILSMTQQVIIMKGMGVPLGRHAQKAHYAAIAAGEEPPPAKKEKKKG